MAKGKGHSAKVPIVVVALPFAYREGVDEYNGVMRYLRESGVPFAFRVPLIPGVNDSAADRAAFAAFAHGANMEFLPYNTAAGAKYPMLGRDMPYRDGCSPNLV